MTAKLLTKILIASLVLLVIGAFGSFYAFSWILSKTVQATDHAKIDAELSRNNIDRLKKLQVDLTNKKDIVLRAQNIVAQSTTYQYQDQIVADLNAYADRAGVSVVGYDFKATVATKPSTTQAPSGVKTTAASVTLNGPMEFERLLKFLKAIEQNLTKMQVSSVGISRDDKNPSLVNSPTIGLEIYVR